MRKDEVAEHQRQYPLEEFVACLQAEYHSEAFLALSIHAVEFGQTPVHDWCLEKLEQQCLEQAICDRERWVVGVIL